MFRPRTESEPEPVPSSRNEQKNQQSESSQRNDDRQHQAHISPPVSLHGILHGTDFPRRSFRSSSFRRQSGLLGLFLLKFPSSILRSLQLLPPGTFLDALRLDLRAFGRGLFLSQAILIATTTQHHAVSFHRRS